MKPVKKRLLWRAIKESRIPIMMGIMTMCEASIEFACSAYPTLWINLFRIGAFYGMSKEGLQRGINVVRQDNIEKQYNEVADELQKLQNIICTVADFQEK